MRVMPIGSCRIMYPLLHLEKTEGLEKASNGSWAHTHEPWEQLQQLRFLRGEFVPPAELVPVIAGPNFNGVRDDLTDVDALVIEVCSRKSFSYHDLILHHLHAPEWFTEAGHEDFGRDLRNGRLPEDRSAYLTDDLDDVKRSLITHARRDVLEREQIREGMLALRAAFHGPIVWATHWEAHHPNGAHVLERQQLIDWVTEIAAELGEPLYSPTTLIRAHGRDVALNDEHHYRDDFMPHVAEALWAELNGVLV